MRAGTLAFLIGTLTLLWLPELPDPMLLEFLPLALLIAIINPRLRVVGLLACGFLLALLRSTLVLQVELPLDLEAKDVTLEGVVHGLAHRDDKRIRFAFAVDRLVAEGVELSWPARVRLSWYGEGPELRPGERWRLTVRLKRPRGFANPGGFDYEAWLFQHRFRATGYVRPGGRNLRLAPSGPLELHQLRYRAARGLASVLEGKALEGLLSALAIGQRAKITPEQWRVLRLTGTGHLMAISGLHVGMVAGGVFLAARWLWALAPGAALWLAAPRAAALAAMAAAGLYAGLAGFSVPTQRALVMLLAFMLGLLLRRSTAPGDALALALLFVLLFDPLAALSAGFWLSFAAVAAILLAASARQPGSGPWARWGRVHWVVALGLLPLSLLFFGRNSLVGPIANLVAVPWVGLLVVPLTLLGTLSLGAAPWLSGLLLGLAHRALELLWPLLEWLARPEFTFQAPTPAGAWVLVLATVGVGLLLAPRPLPARWLGAPLLFPLLWPNLERPAPGGFQLAVLDVGQGLACVVVTHTHTLVYDVGPSFSPRFDAGSAVVAPYLRSLGVRAVDLAVVSHGDRDHAGGLDSLRAEVPVRRLVSGTPEQLRGAERCRAGESWRWDGVDFRFLHPTGDRESKRGLAGDNDRSCVLSVSGPGGTVLLPGDIGRSAEAVLVERWPPRALKADVVVAPHHGSKTSSGQDFVNAVAASHVVFSAGYRNRFGFPAPAVVERYRELDAQVHSTAMRGAVTVRLAPRASTSVEYHRERRRVWSARQGGLEGPGSAK